MITDLQLIDELLCDLRQIPGGTRSWGEIELHMTSVTAAAMQRLREAWAAGEMSTITLSLAEYFRRYPVIPPFPGPGAREDRAPPT